MSVNSVTNNCCCDQEESGLSFVGSSLEHIKEEKGIDLSGLLINKCCVQNLCLNLKSGEEVKINASLMLFMASGCDFYISDKNGTKNNNSSFSILWEKEELDGITNYTYTLNIVNDLLESIVNWNNFHNKTSNTNITNWTEITENWEFYSTSNQTTSLIIVEDQEITGDVQIVNNETITEEILLINGDMEIIYTISIDGDGITLIGITINGSIVSDTIIFQNVTNLIDFNSYDVFIRNIYQYMSMSDIAMFNFKSDQDIYILNQGDTSIKIDTLTATSCEDTDSSQTDCTCS